jgi:hypothetical protein
VGSALGPIADARRTISLCRINGPALTSRRVMVAAADRDRAKALLAEINDREGD